MKTAVIKVSELQPFLEFVRLEREFVVKLTRIKELKEWELNELKQCKKVARKLREIKSKYRFKTNKEMTQQIARYWGYE